MKAAEVLLKVFNNVAFVPCMPDEESDPGAMHKCGTQNPRPHTKRFL
jgi:hypothetical protein